MHQLFIIRLLLCGKVTQMQVNAFESRQETPQEISDLRWFFALKTERNKSRRQGAKNDHADQNIHGLVV